MTIRWLGLLAATLLLLGASACAPNPADDVPAAQVNTDDSGVESDEASDEMADDEMADEAGDEMADEAGDETADDEMADETEGEMADEGAEDGDMSGASGAIALDEGSVGFTGSKVTRSHTCVFDGYEASLDPGDGTAETAQLLITIDTTTILCDPEDPSERFNAHIRDDDFLAVDTYPTATFVSSSIVEGATEGGTHTITGDLTLRDVTNEISFPATIDVTEDRVSGVAEFAIDRQLWNIVYPGQPDDLIRDEVVLQIDLSGQR